MDRKKEGHRQKGVMMKKKKNDQEKKDGPDNDEIEPEVETEPEPETQMQTQTDLKSLLSESQCRDLAVLVAVVTHQRMRRDICDNFEAGATLDPEVVGWVKRGGGGGGEEEKEKERSKGKQGEKADVKVNKKGSSSSTMTAKRKSKEERDRENFEREGLEKEVATSLKEGDMEAEMKLYKAREKEVSDAEVQGVKELALKGFDVWRVNVLRRVSEAVGSKMDMEELVEEVEKKAAVATENEDITRRSKQKQEQDRSRPLKAPSLKPGEEDKKDTEHRRPPRLGDIYPRVPTPLTKLSLKERGLILHSLLLLLISLENYSARSRVLMLYMTSSLKISLNVMQEDEKTVAKGLLISTQDLNADEETQKHLVGKSSSKRWKVAAATAAGAAVIGISGGMVAPMVASGVSTLMGGLGLGTTAAAGYLGTAAGSTYVVGGLFGAYGGRMTGRMMQDLSKGVEDFAFLPVHGRRKEFTDDREAAKEERRLRVTICITGWLKKKEEIVTPWRVLRDASEVFALRWELEALLNLGNAIDTMLESAAWGSARSELIHRTAAAELISSVMLPMGLAKAARVVDNPFTLAKTRADQAGEVLADALINRVQGERAVSLVGYSLGARVIYTCLKSLARKKAFGLVENVVLMGAPTPSDTADWRMMRAVCTGRVVNVFSENDLILMFLYRTSSLQYGVAGIQRIKGLPGVENVDVSETVSGHLQYRFLVGKILQKIGLQDIDKEELKKEEEAFQKMLEEEKEQDYIRRAKEKGYGYFGQGSGKGKQTTDQDSAFDDKEKGEKEAVDMEEEVKRKTAKSMMQWATEQLYIAREDGPSDEAKDKTEDKTEAKVPSNSSKSYYERAKESMHLSRSGSKNENLAKEGISEVGPGYMQQATQYITTRSQNLPSWLPGRSKLHGGVGKDPIDEAGNKAGDVKKNDDGSK